MKAITPAAGEGLSKLQKKSKWIKWKNRMRYFISRHLKEINYLTTVKKTHVKESVSEAEDEPSPTSIRKETEWMVNINCTPIADKPLPQTNNATQDVEIIKSNVEVINCEDLPLNGFIVKPVNICRVCENENNALVNIFENESIFIKIKACTSIKLTEDDHLPKFICPKCEFNLEAAYSFKIQCEQTDRRLRFTAKQPYSRVHAPHVIARGHFCPKVER